VASYKAVNGALLALESFFKLRMPDEFKNGPVNAGVKILGSRDIAAKFTGNFLGIYLHRVSIDPHGRSRFFPPEGTTAKGPAGELPVNLYFLLIASGGSAAIEADLLTWAMLELANEARLDISHLSETDDEWTEREILNISPDEMSIETTMRIWDVFEADYTLTVPYVGRTVRLRLREQRTHGPEVRTRVFPAGVTVE
jgi:hypothetical protein